MIRFVSGDMLLSRAHALGHGVAPGDRFQQGLAASLRERWPDLAGDFRRWCGQESPAAGTLYVWPTPDGRVVANMVTEQRSAHSRTQPGTAALEHVHAALRVLRQVAERDRWPHMALPRLAAGLGGLDWNDIRPAIEAHLGTLAAPVIVYEHFRPGVAASEGI